MCFFILFNKFFLTYTKIKLRLQVIPLILKFFIENK